MNPAIRLQRLDNGLVYARCYRSGSTACYHPDGSYAFGDLSPDSRGIGDIRAAVRQFSGLPPMVPKGWDSVD